MGRAYGNLRDYCIPVNSYFPTPEMLDELTRLFARAARYYPASNEQIAATVSECFQLDAETVVMFNGATELLAWIDQLLLRETIVTPVPTFGRWTDLARAPGKRLLHYQRQSHNQFQIQPHDLIRFVRQHKARVLVLCNPNNPTGAYLRKQELLQVLDALEDISLIVIDESFIDFSDLDQNPSVATEAVRRENVIVVKSLGKSLGLHGIRLGYSVSHPTMARTLRSHVPYWNINAIAELVLETLSRYLHQYGQSLSAVIRDRYSMEAMLRKLPGVTVFPSQANFVFCKMPPTVDGGQLRDYLLTEYGFLVRHCGNKVGSSSAYFRFVARQEHESRALMDALQAALPP